MTPEEALNTGKRFPFDAPDSWWKHQDVEDIPPATDWAHAAARGVIAELQGRLGLDMSLARESIHENTRAAIVKALAKVIRLASPENVSPKLDLLRMRNRLFDLADALALRDMGFAAVTLHDVCNKLLCVRSYIEVSDEDTQDLIVMDDQPASKKVVYAVSNDGGKTGVAWRDNVHDALAYLDLQNAGGITDYAVVAVVKKVKPENGTPCPTCKGSAIDPEGTWSKEEGVDIDFCRACKGSGQDLSKPPCQECGAMTSAEAERKCTAVEGGGCHGCQLWPD